MKAKLLVRWTRVSRDVRVGGQRGEHGVAIHAVLWKRVEEGLCQRTAGEIALIGGIVQMQIIDTPQTRRCTAHAMQHSLGQSAAAATAAAATVAVSTGA